jgi:hypothetical protein
MMNQSDNRQPSSGNRWHSRDKKGGRKPPQWLSVEILMGEPESRKGTTLLLTTFMVVVRRGNQLMRGFEIQEIWIDGHNYQQLVAGSQVKMVTENEGRFEFSYDLNPDFKRVQVAVVAENKRFQQVFPIPQPKKDKPVWFEVTVGNPHTNGKAKGRIIVKTAADGDLVKGRLRVSSNRPFSIAKSEVPDNAEQVMEKVFTVKGEMLFEVEMSRQPEHRQQQIFFVLLETGEEKRKLLVR